VLALERRTRGVLAAIVLVTLLLAPGAVWDRAATSTNLGRAEISHRFDYWEGALLVAEQEPLVGVGVNNFEYAFERLPVPATAQRNAIHAHNIVLMLISETGLMGLLSFGAFLAGTLWLLLRHRSIDPCEGRRLWRVGIAASLLGSLAHQMTDTFLLEPTVNAIVWVYAGLAVVMAAGLLHDDDDPAIASCEV
jgi:O-antigen ligase